MQQQSLATAGFELVTKRKRKREFLDEMNLVMPWTELGAVIQSHTPAGKTGRPHFVVETMIRINFMQQWFGLSDPAMKEALHDVPLYLQFAQLDPGLSQLSDESAILRFRNLLEVHGLSLQIMAVINATQAQKGLMLKTCTAVDATLIAAPSSTKHKNGESAPEMQQAKKGNQWHFGIKAQIGVDADSGQVHSLIDTVAQGHGLLHVDEAVVFADAGYQGPDKRPEATGVAWHVAMRPGKLRALGEDGRGVMLEQAEKLKTSVRGKDEHQFRVIRRQFGHVKARYQGMAKNTAQLMTLLALSNLWMVRKQLPHVALAQA